MWQSYFIVTLRTLLRNRVSSGINIIGLAIGLAACLMTFLYVRSETSYDTHWPEADRIFRVHAQFDLPGADPVISVGTMGPLKGALLKDFPEIDVAARFNVLRPTIRQEGRLFIDAVAFIDPAFLDIFGIEPVQGSIVEGDGDVASLFITEGFALKYFGAGQSIGETLTLTLEGYQRDYKIAAVIPDPPTNSHLTYGAFVYIDENAFRHRPDYFDAWMSYTNLTYFKLSAGVEPASVAAKFDALIDRNYTDWPTGMDRPASDVIRLSQMPIGDIHLHAQGTGELKPAGDIRAVYAFTAIAGLILTIACINFINLTTAQATERAREVVMRKVLGATGSQLVVQFLGESFLITLVAFLLALVLTELAAPWFSALLHVDMGLHLTAGTFDRDLLVVFPVLLISVAFLSGLYPALYLSRFRPAEILAGGRGGRHAVSGRLRQILVIVQFAVSVVLLISTATIYRQMTFLQSADLGYATDNIVLVRRLDRDTAAPNANALRAEIAQLPGVSFASLSNSAPADTFQYTAPVRRLGGELAEDPIIGYRQVDEHFLAAYDIPLYAGRDFDPDRGTDRLPANLGRIPFALRKGAVLLNQAAVRRLGYGDPGAAIGQVLVSSLGDETGRRHRVSLTVIGIVPDLHFSSLKQSIPPEMLIYAATGHNVMTIRYDRSVKPADLVELLRQRWQKIIPDVPFLYDHLDQVLADQYEREARQSVLFATFAGLSVVIAGLGLFGLAAFTVDHRAKEIGIRKVMGASSREIVKLLVFQFSKPVLLANVIAWPFALRFLADWLSIFHYRIDIWVAGPAAALAAVSVSLLIAGATVGGHAVRVARANPVHALRTEEG